MQKQPEMVTWIDSGLHIDRGWANLDIYRSVAQGWKGSVTTVGIPLYEDDEVVVLGLSYDAENDNYFGAQLIAKSSVRERAVLVAVP